MNGSRSPLNLSFPRAPGSAQNHFWAHWVLTLDSELSDKCLKNGLCDNFSLATQFRFKIKYDTANNLGREKVHEKLAESATLSVMKWQKGRKDLKLSPLR